MDNIKSISETQTTAVSQLNHASANPFEMTAISDLMIMMEKMTEILQKLRNVSHQYQQKQSELSWEMQLHAFNTKSAAASQQMSADITSGALGIVSGVASGAGVGIGVGFSKVGREIGSSIGRTTSDTLNGVGSTAQAAERQKAELERLGGELLGENASNYKKNMEEIKQLGQKFSSQMEDISRSIAQIFAKISTSVNMKI